MKILYLLVFLFTTGYGCFFLNSAVRGIFTGRIRLKTREVVSRQEKPAEFFFQFFSEIVGAGVYLYVAVFVAFDLWNN